MARSNCARLVGWYERCHFNALSPSFFFSARPALINLLGLFHALGLVASTATAQSQRPSTDGMARHGTAAWVSCRHPSRSDDARLAPVLPFFHETPNCAELAWPASQSVLLRILTTRTGPGKGLPVANIHPYDPPRHVEIRPSLVTSGNHKEDGGEFLIPAVKNQEKRTTHTH